MLMVANWKMFKTVQESQAFVRELIRRREESTLSNTTEVICPTLPALFELSQLCAGTTLHVGAQNLDLGDEGANTGAVSAYLLREAGAEYVIVGHSERRRLYGEDDTQVGEKAAQAVAAHLVPIVCVGETQSQREEGKTDEVISRQVQAALKALTASTPAIVAYEPVWAIGSGLVPDGAEANRVAGVIRDAASSGLPVLYGGSVNRKNIQEFAKAPLLDGALVGGAALDVAHWMDLTRLWEEVRG